MTDKLDYSDRNYTLLQERRCRIMKEENWTKLNRIKSTTFSDLVWRKNEAQNIFRMADLFFFNTYLSIIPYSKSVFKNIKISKSNLLV